MVVDGQLFDVDEASSIGERRTFHGHDRDVRIQALDLFDERRHRCGSYQRVRNYQL